MSNPTVRIRIRKEVLNKLKKEDEENRKRNLAELFEDDLENDSHALKRDWLSNTSGLPPNPYEKNPMYKSYSMDGESGYILEELSTYAKSIVDTPKSIEVKDLINQEGWLSGITEWFEDDDIVYNPGSGADLLKKTYEDSALIQQHSDVQLWREYILASRFLKKVRVIRRLTDLRNRGLDMDSEPQPDGQNIQDIHLRTAWVLHRAWIRSLHYRSLSLGNKDFGFRQIKDILHLAAIFLAFELQDHGFNPAAKQQNFSHLHGLQSMYNEVLKALENIGTDLARERRPLTGNATYTVDETIAYNIFPERFSKILREHFEPLGSAWRFYAELWERASDFERAHDYEHVEDCLVNKRIVYGDEWSQLTKALKDPDWIPGNITKLPAIEDPSRFSNKVSTTVRKISEFNRLRQSYLALRDWMKRRPWKQLYYICDTKPGAGDELISHIEEFYDRLDSLKDTFPTPPRQHIPTNIANMVSCLFPIHPLAITYLPEFLGGSKCIICQEEFAESPNQIIVQLHCDHAHHYLCVRDYWDDSDTLYGARCPLCRSSGKEWNLHTTAGIAVECLDVWDYERVHPRPLITRGLEDHISDTYKIFEDEKLQQSYLYDELGLGGYRDADDPDTAFVRMPEIEMAVVRWARRKTNAQRRNLHAHLRQSVHSLDPNFVPPALGPQGLGMSPCGPGRDPNFQPSTAISSDDDSDMEDDADMEDGVDMDDDADMEYDA